MTNEDSKAGKEKLETISFRGNRDIWLDFTYTAKKNGEKNAWAVLRELIENYIHNSGRKE